MNAKQKTPPQSIRWLVALMGGDPTQVSLPVHRRQVVITIERGTPQMPHIAIIESDHKHKKRGMNLVYLTGEVVCLGTKEEPEVEIISKGGGARILIRAISSQVTFLLNLRPGDCITLVGTLEGSYVRAHKVQKLDRKPKNALVGCRVTE